jgi:hypothetical protein
MADRKKVTDAELLKMLNELQDGEQAAQEAAAPARMPVQDPAIIEQLTRDQSWSGSILPYSKDAEGNVRFDPNAGLLGSLTRAFTTPKEVMDGTIDPMSDEGIQRALELGMMASPANPAMRAGEMVVPGAKTALRKDVKAPTPDELRAASSKGYETLESFDTIYDPRSVAQMANELRAYLDKQGYRDVLSPKTAKFVDELANYPDGAFFTPSDYNTARRTFRKAAGDFSNPTDQGAASIAIDRLDRFIEAPPSGAVVSGSGEGVAQTAAAARGNYAAAKRSEALEGIQSAAELRASAANSGQNLDNSIRSRLASLRLDPRKIAGFSDEERAAIEGFVEGSPARNVARGVGNFLGGGGGLGALASGYAGATATGNPIGALAPGVGVALKWAENKLAERGVKKLSEETRKRSPLYQERLAAAPYQRPMPEKTMAVIRALMETSGPSSLSSAAQFVADAMSSRDRDLPLRKGDRLN